ncbi:MAG: hypothetical protein HYZ72_02115 [Deltaproteobacteria bacterium]|nr:hypothetical protein [Deltaproteobacteria bacterium]
MAQLLGQLLEKGSLLNQTFSSGFGSAKNLAFRLLEAWRNARATPESIDVTVKTRFQIRFDSS